MQSQLLDSAKDLTSRARPQDAGDRTVTSTTDENQQRPASLERQDSAHYERQPAAWPERRDSAQELQAATEGEAAAAGITSPDTLGDRWDSDTDLALASLRPAQDGPPGNAPTTPASQETADRQAFDSPLHWYGASQQRISISDAHDTSRHLDSPTSNASTHQHPHPSSRGVPAISQGQHAGRSRESVLAADSLSAATLMESSHLQSSPSDSARVVQRRLSRLSPTDSARDLATESPDRDSLHEAARRPSHDSAQDLSTQRAESGRRGMETHSMATDAAPGVELQRPHQHNTPGLARISMTDSVQEMESLRQDQHAHRDTGQDGASPSSSGLNAPAAQHARAQFFSHLAAGDSAKELHIPAVTAAQGGRPVGSSHASPDRQLDAVQLASGATPCEPEAAPSQGAAAGGLSHARGAALASELSPIALSASSGELEGQPMRDAPVPAVQHGVIDQQGLLAACDQNAAGLISRSDSASSTAARSSLQSHGPSPAGPQLLQSLGQAVQNEFSPEDDVTSAHPLPTRSQEPSGCLEQARSAVLDSLAYKPCTSNANTEPAADAPCRSADNSSVSITEAPGLPSPCLEAARRLIPCTEGLQSSAAPLPIACSNTLISASLEQARHSVMMDLGSLPVPMPLPPPTFDWQSDPPPSLEKARAALRAPFALPISPPAEAVPLPMNDQPDHCRGKMPLHPAPLKSPFAAPPPLRHSHPLGAQAGIHAPTLIDPQTAHWQQLPSPPPTHTPQQPEGLIQWHLSGIASNTPSEVQPTSPLSPIPRWGSDVSSLTSFSGVPPWPQPHSSGTAQDHPSSGPSSGWVQGGCAVGDSAAGPSSRPDGGWGQGGSAAEAAPAGSSSGWVQEASERCSSPAGPDKGWMQAPWGSGAVCPAPTCDGIRYGPADASSSHASPSEELSNPSYREWVPESTTLQEARRLMSWEVEVPPYQHEQTDHGGDPGPSRWHAARRPFDASKATAAAMMSEVLHRQDSAQDLHLLE
ncbi:hypothetical protein WJX74_004403 [Apatococcus lobatus]|uniref:Uncharacterized protein n=1 Tax=Apatococcus lobatus TaxID=904363 RepID=A0AAW1SG16_9CHLO